jgi:mono/diheme cytochrome c family protein
MGHVGSMLAAGLKAAPVLLLAGWTLAAPAAATEAGEAAFKARCAACHGPRDIQYWGRQRPDAAARKAWLEQLLRRHYPPPAAELAPIVDYIQAAIAAPASPR